MRTACGHRSKLQTATVMPGNSMVFDDQVTLVNANRPKAQKSIKLMCPCGLAQSPHAGLRS